MSWFKKFKAELAQNRADNTSDWKKLKIAGVLLVGAIIYVGYTRYRDAGPWYLGCADRHGNEVTLKTDKKPRVQGSLVFLEDDIFVAPEDGMTCRIVSVKQVDEENLAKALDNPI